MTLSYSCFSLGSIAEATPLSLVPDRDEPIGQVVPEASPSS